MGAGLYRYCYEMTCRETGTVLDDGTQTIFLSTKGKNKDADALECDISEINAIVEVAQKYAPDYDVDRILEELCGETQQ